MNVSLRQQLLELPIGDRLDEALYLIDELAGHPDTSAQWLQTHLGLTTSEVRIFCALNARPGQVLSKNTLLTALCGSRDLEIKIVDVMVCKIRKKIPAPTKITTVWGVGYTLTSPIEVPQMKLTKIRPNAKTLWTDTADEDLRRMFKSGSHISVIAEELDRSERGIIERIRTLELRKC